MMKENILVFGAGGFIGTYLIDELINDGFNVIGSDINEIGKEYCTKSNVPFVKIDITNKNDFNILNEYKIDAIVHLAALQPANFSYEKYSVNDYVSINTIGTLNILEYAKIHNIKKIIYACSHRNTSGLWNIKQSIAESDGIKIDYKGEYAMFSIAESAATDCVHYYTENYQIQGLVFRLPPVYGFGPHLEIFKEGLPIKTGFQTFIDNAIEGKEIELWGDPTVGRDIIYVKDVVAALILALKNNKVTGLYNITSGYKLTLKEEIETIIKVFWKSEKPPKIILRPEKKHNIEDFVYNNSKAKIDFGWSPKYDFEKLLKDYELEMKNNRFGFLIEKRRQMFINK